MVAELFLREMMNPPSLPFWNHIKDLDVYSDLINIDFIIFSCQHRKTDLECFASTGLQQFRLYWAIELVDRTGMILFLEQIAMDTFWHRAWGIKFKISKRFGLADLLLWSPHKYASKILMGRSAMRKQGKCIGYTFPPFYSFSIFFGGGGINLRVSNWYLLFRCLCMLLVSANLCN